MLSFEDGWNIFGLGWLANEYEEGADQIPTDPNDPSDHSIFSFFNDISNLQEGKYVCDDNSGTWGLQ
ncbi:MAG TPA: hypothetical protein VG605_12870 [Puia sp.]|nr:hypothetical protein [Puia sp.]